WRHMASVSLASPLRSNHDYDAYCLLSSAAFTKEKFQISASGNGITRVLGTSCIFVVTGLIFSDTNI
ncbi:MAG TPA: hypothetical protein VLG09_03565, partial [Candidatus Saccharimonadales bacterium]|nr:hypothetical protein [Candidatus Saccharimonadales bacterium]